MIGSNGLSEGHDRSPPPTLYLELWRARPYQPTDTPPAVNTEHAPAYKERRRSLTSVTAVSARLLWSTSHATTEGMVIMAHGVHIRLATTCAVPDTPVSAFLSQNMQPLAIVPSHITNPRSRLPPNSIHETCMCLPVSLTNPNGVNTVRTADRTIQNGPEHSASLVSHDPTTQFMAQPLMSSSANLFGHQNPAISKPYGSETPQPCKLLHLPNYQEGYSNAIRAVQSEPRSSSVLLGAHRSYHQYRVMITGPSQH